jgi:hypothetical protein
MAGSIDQLIVKGPYGEPERHWRYDRENRTFSLEVGRRPALDLEKKLLESHHVVFSSGLNEDLGATAIFGSQMVGLFPRPRYDGVLGIAVGGGVPTIKLRIDYLWPAVGGALTGTARLGRAGCTVAPVDVNVYDEQRTLVAVGGGTYSGQRG